MAGARAFEAFNDLWEHRNYGFDCALRFPTAHHLTPGFTKSVNPAVGIYSFLIDAYRM